MQPDVGGVWRQEILRRMREAQLDEAARRPDLPPRRPGRVAVWWRSVADGLHGRRRRSRRAGTPVERTAARPDLDQAPGGVWQEAVRSCAEALAVRPDLVGVWVGLSLAAGRLGDLELAEGAYEVARVLSPDEAAAWRDALERDFPEIDLAEAGRQDVVLPQGAATSGNGR